MSLGYRGKPECQEETHTGTRQTNFTQMPQLADQQVKIQSLVAMVLTTAPTSCPIFRLECGSCIFIIFPTNQFCADIHIQLGVCKISPQIPALISVLDTYIQYQLLDICITIMGKYHILTCKWKNVNFFPSIYLTVNFCKTIISLRYLKNDFAKYTHPCQHVDCCNCLCFTQKVPINSAIFTMWLILPCSHFLAHFFLYPFVHLFIAWTEQSNCMLPVSAVCIWKAKSKQKKKRVCTTATHNYDSFTNNVRGSTTTNSLIVTVQAR